eukprot:COSAG06_NODE_253_length_19061_cov_33.083114_3_plen_94_part_00
MFDVFIVSQVLAARDQLAQQISASASVALDERTREEYAFLISFRFCFDFIPRNVSCAATAAAAAAAAAVAAAAAAAAAAVLCIARLLLLLLPS